MKIANPKIIRKGALVGTFDLQFPSGLIVLGVRLFEKGNQRWASFPSREWTKLDGAKTYSPILEFASRDIADKFQKQIVPLAEKELLENENAPSSAIEPSKQDRQRRQWSGSDGPNDLPF
jgi:hypothetical protein